MLDSTLTYDGGWTDTASGHLLVSLPDGYDADRSLRWPLLIYLHGANERGTDLELATTHGPVKERRAGRDLPFVMAVPQVPEGERWTVGRVVAALDAVTAAHRIDSDRVYLTGLSMGGFGTWEAIERVPERFAAAVPICGGGNPLGLVAAGAVPVWTFHGAQDDVVPLAATEWMVRSLRDVGGDVRLTVYPEATHDSWTATYASPEVYDWLLSHRISDRIPS
ncbi:MAG: prolyl oligopeptidase family serine peptidase [Bacteroidota bacterium]